MRYIANIIILIACTINFPSPSYADGFVDIGYANGDINGTIKSGISLGYGANFGEIYKQTIGFNILFLGDGNSASEDKGNIGDIYYNLGYQFLPNVIGYGSLGYGFQSLGRVSNTSVYAGGLSVGGGIQYGISNNLSIDINYKKYNLSFDSVSYDSKVTSIALLYRFGKR